MAASPVVTCPECEKKFKPKADVAGKKIKCPFCKEPFVVPAAAEKETVKAGKEAPQVKAAPEEAATNDYDADPNPYGVKTVDLVPRCPNCTQEMGEHDIICLACGYNTLTRQWGKTEKTIGVTQSRQFIYLLAPVGSVIFVFCSFIGLLVFYIVIPSLVVDSKWFGWLDSEATRMWTTLPFLFIMWMAGMFCFHKFIEKPKPDEIKME